MTTSISASATLVSAAASSTSSSGSSSLVKLANGEYSADSVAKDPTDAAKLGLVREKDGNYGTTAASQVAPTSKTSLSSGTSAALSSLTLGGA